MNTMNEESVERLYKEFAPCYRKVRIFGKDDFGKNYTDDCSPIEYLKWDSFQLLRTSLDLVLLIMNNGGVKVLKDRYDYYGTDRIYFAE